MKTRTLALLLGAALLLAGCGGMRIVDSDVSSFTAAIGPTPAITLPAPYRFERLPSQQSVPAQQDALEHLLEPVLAQAGLQRNDAAAQYSVQVTVRTFRDPQAPWDDPRYVQGYVRAYPFMTPYGVWMRNPSMNVMQFDMPYYRRELHLVLRRLSDAQVVYETRAQHDGRWPDDQAVLPAMVQAALQGFPTPVSGPRRIAIEIPR